jgi:hypothetical protein
MPEPAWSLHAQLENDTTPVGDLALSRLLAIDDAVWPWLVLVPRRSGIVEITDLGADAATSCRSFTSTSSRGGWMIRCGQNRCGVCTRRAPVTPRHLRSLLRRCEIAPYRQRAKPSLLSAV